MNSEYSEKCTTKSAVKIEGDPEKLRAIEDRIKKTIADYKMISPDDKVLVAVSGGKDSTVLLYLLKKFGYDVSAITVNSQIGCFSDESLKRVQEFCKLHEIELHVADFIKNYGHSVCYITDILESKGEHLGTCTVCGVLRRRLINKAARELKATKVALGHNMDDEVQAFLMNLLRNRQSLNARLGPVPGIITDKAFVQRIKPLHFTSEEDVTYYSQAKGFPVKYGECPCASKSFRWSVKEFIKECEKEYPDMKINTMKFLMTKLPSLKEKFKTDQILKACKICREPSATDMCRSCTIIKKLKQPS